MTGSLLVLSQDDWPHSEEITPQVAHVAGIGEAH